MATMERFRLWRAKRRQTTFVYCPSCSFELVWGGEMVSDAEDSGVVYRCARCGIESVWDFDLFPVPVLGGRFG